MDLYHPSFDEETGADFLTQTRLFWQEIYRADIDVRNVIIVPALARRQAQYAADQGDPAHKNRLRKLGE